MIATTHEGPRPDPSQDSHEEPAKGWESIAAVFELEHPFFKNTIYLQGYEYSSNVYVVSGDGIHVIDPGNDYTAFLELFQMGYDPARVRQVILTHGHFDHAMGTMELFRYVPILEKKELQVVLHEAGPSELKEMVHQMGFPIREVQGGEVLDVAGFPLEVIHTPGHTLDGICLYHPPTETVFTGDTVLPDSMAAPDKHAGGRMDHYLYGLRNLLKKEIRHVLPGHGLPVVSIGRRVVEVTYEGLMKKIIGVESEIPWTEAATLLARKGCLEEALYCADRATVLKPEETTGWKIKALCLNDLGRFEEAIEAFGRLVRETDSPDSRILAPLGTGYALMGLGRYEESLTYFDRVLRENPDLKDAHLYKGMALYLAGRPEEAMDIEIFRQEFAGRIKEELQRRADALKGSDAEGETGGHGS